MKPDHTHDDRRKADRRDGSTRPDDVLVSASRRRALALGGAALTWTAAGCLDGEEDEPDFDDFLGSTPPGGRPEPEGTSMDELPDLSGSLVVYSGRGEPLVGDLMSYIDSLYPDLELTTDYGSSADLSNQILTEGDDSPADVFYTVNAGALGALSSEGMTTALTEETLSEVDESFQDPDGEWIGTSGRARTVPYNTESLSEEDVPSDVMEFPGTDAFADSMGWAPTYGSFQDFVTAMRVLEGREATVDWLEAMIDLGVSEYSNEQAIANAVADGEIDAGFANHYYIQRTLSGDPEAPLATAFTRDDAGAVFNVAGAAVIEPSQAPETAENFVRHLLSAEAQEFFAVRTGEYPLIPGVEPLGDLPTIDELEPPEIDLSELSDVEPTLDILRDVGLL
ncbi:MAG: iron ABC transporter substrate-binding protein [Halobacteriota archaeon]